MKLDEFIKEALVDIKNGIELANEEIGSDVFRIQPGNNTELIDFDVAVTAESKTQDSSGANIGGIITVLGFNLGGKLENTNLNITVSRIKFKITSLLIK